ncbi:MAG: hypothetical protein HZC55_19705 [Verrucomicrobia bacterium]|nr:hypothetical protein [Verrucomicrobiota bacterium]
MSSSQFQPLLGTIALLTGFLPTPVCGVTITDAIHEGRAQFRIETARATYFYDRSGGGFSRLIDRDGNDWISFKKEPLSGTRAAAGAGYRGIPNLVFGAGNPDAGAGHPGHDQCESTVIAADAIRTVSKSGRWGWVWRFSEEHAALTIEKADPERPYWFLYEGTIGGRWSPRSHFWGTNRGGPRREQPFGRDKVFDSWRWVYFGDDAAPRVLLAAQVAGDDASDTLWYMGTTAEELAAPDGMIVFGFGRGAAGPLLRGAGQRFLIGLVEETAGGLDGHARLADVAARWLAAAESADGAPSIEVWYGDEQHFGRLGVPQKWINILGRATARAGLASLHYSLNGAVPMALSVGADGYRLARPGDFNIDLEYDALPAGANILKLVASDVAGRRAERTVTVHCHRGRVWPLPYAVDWRQEQTITDAVQIVDGRWKLEAEGVRTVEPYYDRILAFGDRTWTDYTVTVAVTFHSYAPPLKSAPTYGVAHAAIAARFPGHFADQRRPHVQWYPLGAVAEFRLGQQLDQSSWRIFRDGTANSRAVAIVEPRMRRVELGIRYQLKLRVDTLPGPAARYRVKSWKYGDPEPARWDMDSKEGGATIASGGALLVSHNTDVTFGKFTATQNDPEEP